MGGNIPPRITPAYIRPFRGFSLPSYWISPRYSINNYAVYGLSRPSNGNYWSRYYNDAVLMNNRGYVYDSVPNVRWDNAPVGYAPQTGYAPQGGSGYRPDYAPTMRPDAQAYNWGDEGYDPRKSSNQGGSARNAQNDRREAGTYQGEWNGGYTDPQGETYRGEWEGTYTGQDGRQYEGTYRGTAKGAPRDDRAIDDRGRTAGAPYEDRNNDYMDRRDEYPASNQGGYQSGSQDNYQSTRGYEGYERCLRSNGVAGGAIGGVVGAIAGNRIAGRGNRLAGSLIGGGLGALAGLGIEKATKKCDRYLPREEYRTPVSNRYPTQNYPQQPYPSQGYPTQPYPQQGGGYGWQGGYYYPQQQAAPTTTVSVTPGTATTTTTTTEEVVYEDVYSYAPRKHAVRKYRPRAKPRCGC